MFIFLVILYIGNMLNFFIYEKENGLKDCFDWLVIEKENKFLKFKNLGVCVGFIILFFIL